MLSFCGAYLSLGCPGRLVLLVLEVRPTRLAVAVEVAHCVLFVREAALWGRCCRRLPQRRVPRLVRPVGVYHGRAVNGGPVILLLSSGLWYSKHGVQGGRACVVSRGRNVTDHVVSGRLCRKTVIFLSGPKFVIRHVWRRARYAWRSRGVGLLYRPVTGRALWASPQARLVLVRLNALRSLRRNEPVGLL